MAEDGGRVPMSPGLQATLLRARDYAAGQSEAQVLLEHLLLALSEDADAANVLDACQVDLGRLRNDVAGYLGALDDRVPPGTPGAPAISPALTQVLRYATLAAQQGRRTSIDGAIVLAALVGDGRSMAASFLKAQGLTFEAAIQALRQAVTRGAAGPHAQVPGQAPFYVDGPSAQPVSAGGAMATTTQAEDILARARERVETRSQYRPETPQQAQPPSSAEPAPQPSFDAPPPTAAAEDARLSSPPDPVTELPGAKPRPPDEPWLGSTPTEAIAQAATPLAQDHANETPFAPTHSPLPPAGPPADEARQQDEPAAAGLGAPIAPPMPSKPLPDPNSRAPSGTDFAAAPAATQSTAPPQAAQTEQSSPQPGWVPPPVPPVAAPQPAVRSLPPPPPSWSTPPSPPMQPSLSPGRPLPTRTRETDLAPAPAHWSRPQSPVDARREPSTAGYAPPALAPPPATSEHGGPAGRRPAVDPSQVTHSLPRRLRQGRSHVIEVWIERPPIAGNNASRSFALRAENVVARAIAVRLRPLSGKFIIDAASPETQWDQSGAAGPNRLASEAAVWRYTVTPLQAGRGVLQLAISARTLGADGVLAETQLPDQTHELRVAPRYGSLLRRLFFVLGSAIAGMVAIKLVETQMEMDVYYLFKQLLRYRP